jgi:hypothetical protein
LPNEKHNIDAQEDGLKRLNDTPLKWQLYEALQALDRTTLQHAKIIFA